jgi:hypothetical protein
MQAFGEADSPLARDTTRQAWVEKHGRDGRPHLHHAPGCEHRGQTGFRAEALHETALREGMRTLRQERHREGLGQRDDDRRGARDQQRLIGPVAAVDRAQRHAAAGSRH